MSRDKSSRQCESESTNGTNASKKQKTTTTDDLLALSLNSSSLTTVVAIYVRQSVGEKVESACIDSHVKRLQHEVLKMNYSVGVTITEIHSAFKGTDKANPTDFNDMALIRFLNNPIINGVRIRHLFVISADRLARNLALGGQVISLCTRWSITIHIVGDSTKYYKVDPVTRDGQPRLLLEMLNATNESQDKVERNARNSETKLILKASLPQPPPRPYEPPFVSEDMKSLLTLMIFGSSIQNFYDAFNKMLDKNPNQPARYGADWIFKQDDNTEMTNIEKFAINFTRMVKTFSEWELCRENKKGMLKKKWTKTKLAEVIVHHFGQDIFDKINKKWNEFDDDNEDMEDVVAAQPAVSDRLPHQNILEQRDVQRDILCDFCQATNVYGHKFCHECGYKIEY